MRASNSSAEPWSRSSLTGGLLRAAPRSESTPGAARQAAAQPKPGDRDRPKQPHPRPDAAV